MRRFLLLIFLACLLVGQCSAAIAFIGNAKASNTAAGTATTSAADISGANLLVAVVMMYSKSACTATVSSTSNASGTWASVQNYANGNSNICVWYCKNPATSASEMFSVNPNGTGYPTIFASWWSGADTTSPLDQQTGASSATGTTLATGNITPTSNGQLIITGISDPDTGNKTVDVAFTRQDIDQNNAHECGAWGYVIQSTAAAIGATWTEANSGVPRSVAIASFKAGGAGPSNNTSAPPQRGH